ncbi:oxygenase MpaB family protein [Streptomyces sp. NPDC090306]|uniref:oxygenase MpaB family protein n=1 Tax=Streptomyces sp. NPDC090306 TaxID=3365961 RepID=UPI0038051148
MGRYRRLHQIERLDPERDHERIFWLLTQYEFPWDYLQGVSVAFLRDFAVPRVSRLLDRTQEFERAGRKRYDDTVLIAYEMVREGMDSEHGRSAVRHLNRIHHRYRIANEDYLYVLATTVVGPRRWIARYGWRPLVPAEVESLARVGRRMGELMGIDGLPADYAGFERLHDDYERRMFAYDPANRRVAAATLRVAASAYPRPLRPLATRLSLAVLDEPLLTALGLPRQPRLLRAVAHHGLRARALLVRRMPARPDRWPHRQKPRSYPFGWTLDDLGPRWAHDRPLRPLPDEDPPPHVRDEPDDTPGDAPATDNTPQEQ